MPNDGPEMKCRERDGDALEIELSGRFAMETGRLPACPDTGRRNWSRVVFLDKGISQWDTTLLALVLRSGDGAEVDVSDLPEGVRTLYRLSRKRAGAGESPPERKRPYPLEKLGLRAGEAGRGAAEMISFAGDIILSLGRLLRGRARFRSVDLWRQLRNCGPDALGIVTVISVLVGAILAFVGAVQLRMFGAEIFVADLVGLGMVMEMGALMTGVILAGRSGASFAAQLGAMQVNEEVDALKTMGIPPSDYLVLPRVVALSCMTPLLVMYANVLGIAGGALVGVFMLKLPLPVFLDQTFRMMVPWDVWQGLIKGAGFGVWIAVAGCLRGMQSGRGASDVGRAATSAVVTGILGIVVIDALWTWLFMLMD